MLRTGRIIFVGGVLVLLGVLGCRKGGPGSSGGVAYDPSQDPLVNPAVVFSAAPEDLSQIETEETLVLQLDGSPNTLNPIFVSSMYEFIVVDTLYAGLFTFDKDMKWRVNENLVESYEESEDHKTFIVKIKEGVKWHDGMSLTAADVVFTWEQILDDAVPCYAQKPSVEPITECVALDTYTVKYVQSEPLATAQWNLLFPIIPKHVFSKEKKEHPDLKTGPYYNRQSRHPVGNGMYRIVEWKENDKIVVERNEDYIGKKPYFKKIIFKIIPDSNITLLSFEKQDIDVVRRLSAQQFALETNTERFREAGHKVWGVEWSFAYIGWNMDGSNPFFADKRVREAMTHALNLELILEKIYYNLATRCHGIYHPDSWMYNPDIELLKYDLGRSAQLLDEAGWLVDADDGWRYRTVKGERVRFSFTLTMPQGSPSAPKVAAIFQQDLKKLGVNLKTHTMEWSSFLEKIRNHEFQAEIAAWGTGTDPDTGWNLWRTEEYEKGRNYGGYSNKRVDELFLAGRREFDFGKRRAIYQEIHKRVYEDQPYLWLYNAPVLAAVNKRIRGVQLSPRGIYNFDPSFYEWWVTPGQAKYARQRP
ncbi:MAG: hypothetical protein IID32_06320 [Planctomycetes bacterium]|nr:hypothetical protein [Planctomycetota bacterium]